MNLQQLEYIIAVDQYRHFGTAADKCFVTQPTLSMMIRKLEEELGGKIFDRSRHPVVPTEQGKAIIVQAKVILREAGKLKDVFQSNTATLSGELRIGIIPTLAPYLIPVFLNDFLSSYPAINLKISETETDQIIDKLRSGKLDAGLMATPLNLPELMEDVLFHEQFVVYGNKDEELLKKKYVLPSDLSLNRLWLLEEGHCLRSQVLNLCELRRKELHNSNFEFESGSVETLKKMVDQNRGITILPELALKDLTAREMKQVRYFRSPSPVREISIVTYRHFVKENLIGALKASILKKIPSGMKKLKGVPVEIG